MTTLLIHLPPAPTTASNAPSSCWTGSGTIRGVAQARPWGAAGVPAIIGGAKRHLHRPHHRIAQGHYYPSDATQLILGMYLRRRACLEK
jgi:hypothetical protein